MSDDDSFIEDVADSALDGCFDGWSLPALLAAMLVIVLLYAICHSVS